MHPTFVMNSKIVKPNLDCEECRYLYEERAAIHEFDGGLSRKEAEALAASERCAEHKEQNGQTN